MENNENKQEIVLNKENDKPKKRFSLLTIKLPNMSLGLLLIIMLAVVGITLLLISKDNFKTQEKVIKLGFEDIGELVTQTCHTTVLEDSHNDRKFFELFIIPFTESRQIFSYDYDVEAALDFAKISIVNIDDSKKTIDLTLPHASLRQPTLLPDSLMVYLDEESLFSRINLLKHNEALKKMEAKAIKGCTDNKLIELADVNAQKLINAFIKSNEKYRNYRINFSYEGVSSNEQAEK